MPKINVVDMAGKVVSELELNENVFGIEPNKTAMHSVVVNYLANQRQGTQSTLTRTEVSGGGRKPWRQKGTGHARQGSTRSPQWRHGGIALGPKPRSYIPSAALGYSSKGMETWKSRLEQHSPIRSTDVVWVA